VGEFGLIDRIARIAGGSAGKVVVGIGDDSAVIDGPGPDYLLATVDSLVEGRHFWPDAPPEILGRRALAINISDIAAMGGSPEVALISLLIPPDSPAAWVEALYSGLAEEARQFGIVIAGGNVTASVDRAIDVTLLGSVPKDQLILRSGARPGDVVAITGSLGDYFANRMMSGGRSSRNMTVPTPRVLAGRALAASGLVHAMMDISDGIAGDIQHLARSSGVGIELEALPMLPETRELALSLDRDPTEFVMSGGEDYELMFTVAEADWPRIQSLIADPTVTRIGTVTDQSRGVVVVGRDGRMPIKATGWTHF
jgi:thiamine-monophosphate kinase